jgi:tetratricopeptide (TPR) repeat protein
MSKNIENMLNEAFSLVSNNRDYERAIEVCNEIIDTFPLRADGFRQRAWVFSHQGILSKALDDISLAIDKGEDDPHDFALRGRWFIGVGNFKAAIEDQSKVIDIGEESQFFYHTESAYFFRAVAFFNVQQYQDAINDLSKVRDDFLLYEIGIGKLSKKDILEKCNRNLK